jgi:hypothetical protein
LTILHVCEKGKSNNSINAHKVTKQHLSALAAASFALRGFSNSKRKRALLSWILSPPFLEEQKLQTALAQDNANVSTTRLNTMLLYTQNMLAHLEIISAAQVKR